MRIYVLSKNEEILNKINEDLVRVYENYEPVDISTPTHVQRPTNKEFLPMWTKTIADVVKDDSLSSDIVVVDAKDIDPVEVFLTIGLTLGKNPYLTNFKSTLVIYNFEEFDNPFNHLQDGLVEPINSFDHVIVGLDFRDNRSIRVKEVKDFKILGILQNTDADKLSIDIDDKSLYSVAAIGFAYAKGMNIEIHTSNSNSISTQVLSNFGKLIIKENDSKE